MYVVTCYRIHHTDEWRKLVSRIAGTPNKRPHLARTKYISQLGGAIKARHHATLEELVEITGHAYNEVSRDGNRIREELGIPTTKRDQRIQRICDSIGELLRESM